MPHNDEKLTILQKQLESTGIVCQGLHFLIFGLGVGVNRDGAFSGFVFGVFAEESEFRHPDPENGI